MTVIATPLKLGENENGILSDGSYMTLVCSLAFSSNYATGGDALDFLPFFAGLCSQVLYVEIVGGAGNQFEYDKVNKKIKGFSAANTEIAAAAYNAAITGDTNIIAVVAAK